MVAIDNPNILYHYTTIEVLFSIVNNAIRLKSKEENKTDSYELEFWATHAGFLNDPTEFNHFLTCLKERLKEYERFNKISFKERKRMETVDFLEVVKTPVFCLSASEDNLPMWRCYSNNGQGVAIGFSFQELKRLETSKDYELVECEYPETKEIIEDADIKNLYNSLGGACISIPADGRVEKLRQMSFKLKHPAYKYENEWRLKFKEFSEYEYRLKNSAIIPYIKFGIPISAIREIWIGPTVGGWLLKNSLIEFINKMERVLENKCTISVLSSSIPYTSL